MSFLWAPAAVPRSLRGRPSQVKGAFGVAARWRKRHPGPASLHGPSGQRCGQARGLPSTTRGTAAGPVTSNGKTPAAYPQVITSTASKFAIMKVDPQKRQ